MKELVIFVFCLVLFLILFFENKSNKKAEILKKGLEDKIHGEIDLIYQNSKNTNNVDELNCLNDKLSEHGNQYKVWQAGYENVRFLERTRGYIMAKKEMLSKTWTNVSPNFNFEDEGNKL